MQVVYAEVTDDNSGPHGCCFWCGSHEPCACAVTSMRPCAPLNTTGFIIAQQRRARAAARSQRASSHCAKALRAVVSDSDSTGSDSDEDMLSHDDDDSGACAFSSDGEGADVLEKLLSGNNQAAAASCVP